VREDRAKNSVIRHLSCGGRLIGAVDFVLRRSQTQDTDGEGSCLLLTVVDSNFEVLDLRLEGSDLGLRLRNPHLIAREESAHFLKLCVSVHCTLNEELELILNRGFGGWRDRHNEAL
jgi:hypothetical protein